MAQTYHLDPVSEELHKILDQEAHKPTADKKDEVATLLNSERFVSTYDTCIWWDGCYYCQDENDNWYCIRCSFF
ncbi:MAG: hypothetical protein F6K14_00155 [Symploca sp. SIO2C1]|nr:hypothetical protein [Symploca sp. SIO2C1]